MHHNQQEFNHKVGYHYTFNFQDSYKSYDSSVAFHVLLDPFNENDIEKDITILKDFDLEDSFTNAMITVTTDVYSINKDCMRGYCPYCINGMVSSTSHRNLTGINIQIPCNICNGKGYRSLQPDCNHFIVTPREFNVTLPPGIFPGYYMRYAGLGNQLQVKDSINKKMALVTGDLVVIVQSVTSKSNNSSSSDDDNKTNNDNNRHHFTVDQNRHVVLTVPICADEVLHGFEKKILYVQGTVLNINRRNKVTLPDTVVTLTGHGIPSMNGNKEDNNDSSNSSKSSNNSSNYEDMKIIFTLEEEDRCIEMEMMKTISNQQQQLEHLSSFFTSSILRYDGLPQQSLSAEICIYNSSVNEIDAPNDISNSTKSKQGTLDVFIKLQESFEKIQLKQRERQKESITRKLIKMLQKSVQVDS